MQEFWSRDIFRQWQPSRQVEICRGDWGAFRLRCAVHSIKIRARVLCVICTFLYKGLLGPQNTFKCGMTIEKPEQSVMVGYYFFSIFDNLRNHNLNSQAFSGTFAQRLFEIYNHCLVLMRQACTCHCGQESGPLALLRLQELQNSESQMFMLRVKTLSAQDHHWRTWNLRGNVQRAAISKRTPPVPE